VKVATIYVHDADTSWTETYREGEHDSFQAGEPDIEAWCRRLVQRFNETLRPHEKVRTVDKVEMTEDSAPVVLRHDWHKTNAITISDRHGTYDRMRCDRCGITGKRFGLHTVLRDRAFRAKAFETCTGAQALLAKRERRSQAGTQCEDHTP
jgi:hypothetical protein